MMPANLLLLSCLFFFPFAALAGSSTSPPTDSTKYRGYRLELTNFKKIKEKSDWLKISFTIVNTGKMNVDMGKQGTEHWVVFNFDKSIFTAKLGGYRDNIKRQLTEDNFKLDAGEMISNMELKIPNVLPTPPQETIARSPVISEKPEPIPNEQATNTFAWDNSLPSVKMAEKGMEKEKTLCPDIAITTLKIVQQDNKYATLQYTLTNQGQGVFYLFGKNQGGKDNLLIKSYLSGVTTLTRGALPIGVEALTEEIRRTNELHQGESLTAQIKIDIRKKTRYMKSLILSIENPQFVDECDRTNNSMGVVLE